MPHERWRAAKREIPAIVGMYVAFGLAVGYLLVTMESATYRDEWGFAEFHWARSLHDLRTPDPVVDPGALAYYKVEAITFSLASEALAAGLAHATGQPLETFYVYGFWGALLAPALGYMLLRRVASPLWSAIGAAAATTLTVGFPFYLVDPRGLMITTHGLFLLMAWRAMVTRTPRAAFHAVLAAFLTTLVYFPFGAVELAMLAILLAASKARAATLAVAIGVPLGVATLVPTISRGYVIAILNHARLPSLAPTDVPYLRESTGPSVQLLAAAAFALLLVGAILLCDASRPSHRFLMAATLAASMFVILPFSMHRLFTFVAAPLALVLAEAASHRLTPGNERRTLIALLARRIRRPAAATAVLAVLAAPSVTLARTARPAAWRTATCALLAASFASLATYPGTDVAQYGTFSRDYLDGVEWVAQHVEGPFMADLKFASAVYAYTGSTRGHHVSENFDETGELTRMWYSPGTEETIRVLHEHGTDHLVLTTEMADILIVADYYRVGVADKMAQVRASPAFRLVYANPQIEVYALLE